MSKAQFYHTHARTRANGIPKMTTSPCVCVCVFFLLPSLNRRCTLLKPQSFIYRTNAAGEWDPKITTPPGLYIFAVAYARLVTAAEGLVGLSLGLEHCSAQVLRQVNWLFSLGTLAVMRSIFLRRMVRKRVSLFVFFGGGGGRGLSSWRGGGRGDVLWLVRK